VKDWHAAAAPHPPPLCGNCALAYFKHRLVLAVESLKLVELLLFFLFLIEELRRNRISV
jgi:hypothetical protein